MTTRTAVTADELLRMPSDGLRRELVSGELRTMPPAGFEHGAVSVESAAAVRDYVREHRLGRVVGAETGFRIGRDPDTVRAPDVAFVRADRLPPRSQWGRFLDLAPDLAVEVVSPSDRMPDVGQKAQEWLAAGTQVVWVLLPELQAVDVHTSDGTIRLGPGDLLDGGAVLPGFAVTVADLFA